MIAAFQPELSDDDLLVQFNMHMFGRHLVGGCVHQPYTYSIGNANCGCPEVIIMGAFNPEVIAIVANLCSERIIDLGFTPDKIDIGADFPVRTRKAGDEAKRLMSEASRVLGRDDYEVVQLLLCDTHGIYPGEPGCAPNFDVPMV